MIKKYEAHDKTTMQQVHQKSYKGVRILFKDLEAFQPMCTAVLEGAWQDGESLEVLYPLWSNGTGRM